MFEFIVWLKAECIAFFTWLHASGNAEAVAALGTVLSTIVGTVAVVFSEGRIKCVTDGTSKYRVDASLE